jgi:sorbitol-specific phosphotransferase system component IIBC
MEKHLLIGKGSKGWGGPLKVTLGQPKKSPISRGHSPSRCRPPV